jgi:hypothetical protein
VLSRIDSVFAFRPLEGLEDLFATLGEPLGAGHSALEYVGRQQLHHPDRIVRGAAPEGIVELPKHVPRRRGPTPPEIARKRLQAVDAFRK